MTARFITLEGGEGVGKSTQLRRLCAALRDQGHDVIETREPGGSPGAEAIRTLLMTGDAGRWNAGAEALLFAAARADHLARTIRPALERGQWVVCDRFIDSSRAYQGGADGIPDADILRLHAIGSGGFMPDRTLLLTLPPEEAAQRASARDGGASDRFGARDAAYHARVAASRALADADPARFRIVEAQGVAEDVTARLVAALDGAVSALIGHDHAIASLMDAAQHGRLHHAWLLAGPRGVGKALFADLAARRLLADAAGPPFDLPGLDVPHGHRTAALVDAGSHPDLIRLERHRDEKAESARNISIEQVRSLQRLFSTTGSFSSRRIVIIDAIDDLERNAANALLKNLEEPPTDSLFLLVSHAPGRLLPTIRSRCRMLRFQPLGDDVMQSILARALPEATIAEIAALVRAGEGAPGRALAFAGLGLDELDTIIDRLIREGDVTNGERAKLARSLGTKAAQPRYEAFLERVPNRIADHAQTLSGPALARALHHWEQARTMTATAVSQSFDPQATVFALAGMLAALAPEAGSGKG